MRLTMPQILMLNHAAWVNKKRQDVRLERNKNSDSVHDNIESSLNAPGDEDVVWNGKRWSELNSDEMAAYLAAGV